MSEILGTQKEPHREELGMIDRTDQNVRPELSSAQRREKTARYSKMLDDDILADLPAIFPEDLIDLIEDCLCEGYDFMHLHSHLVDWVDGKQEEHALENEVMKCKWRTESVVIADDYEDLDTKYSAVYALREDASEDDNNKKKENTSGSRHLHIDHTHTITNGTEKVNIDLYGMTNGNGDILLTGPIQSVTCQEHSACNSKGPYQMVVLCPHVLKEMEEQGQMLGMVSKECGEQNIFDC